jgi:predicted RNase H-like nuclease (RuvC/YqgF family)
MARTGITSEQVYQAADALIEEGVTPTVHTVREHLGTGSFSTITGYLSAWRADREAAKAAHIPDPPEAVTRLFREMWAASWRANHEALGNERQAVQAARQQMEAERGEMSREIEALEQSIERAEERNAAQAAELARIKEEETRLRTRLEEAQKAAEGLRAELAAEREARAKAGEQIARLESALETSRNHLEGQVQAERARAERLETLLAGSTAPKPKPKAPKKTAEASEQ